MRIFMIAGTLITVAIIGIMAAMYMNAASAPVTTIPETQTPYGTIGGASSQMNAIDTARELASVDRARQQDMQDIINRTYGGGANP